MEAARQITATMADATFTGHLHRPPALAAGLGI
jgi:hypothetical protein